VKRVKALKKQQQIKIHPKKKITILSGKTSRLKFNVQSSEFFSLAIE